MQLTKCGFKLDFREEDSISRLFTVKISTRDYCFSKVLSGTGVKTQGKFSCAALSNIEADPFAIAKESFAASLFVLP